MITKTKAQKYVDEWYKKLESCSKQKGSERKCHQCEYDRAIAFPIAELPNLAYISHCDYFLKLFNSLDE